MERPTARGDKHLGDPASLGRYEVENAPTPQVQARQMHAAARRPIVIHSPRVSQKVRQPTANHAHASAPTPSAVTQFRRVSETIGQSKRVTNTGESKHESEQSHQSESQSKHESEQTHESKKTSQSKHRSHPHMSKTNPYASNRTHPRHSPPTPASIALSNLIMSFDQSGFF